MKSISEEVRFRLLALGQTRFRLKNQLAFCQFLLQVFVFAVVGIPRSVIEAASWRTRRRVGTCVFLKTFTKFSNFRGTSILPVPSSDIHFGVGGIPIEEQLQTFWCGWPRGRRLQNCNFLENSDSFLVQKIDFRRFLVVWRVEMEFGADFRGTLVHFSLQNALKPILKISN